MIIQYTRKTTDIKTDIKIGDKVQKYSEIYYYKRLRRGWTMGMGNNAKEIKLQAEGITCTGCAMDMENILRDKEGILYASVNFTDGTINIRYDPDVIDEKQVFLTVRKLGFKTKNNIGISCRVKTSSSPCI